MYILFLSYLHLSLVGDTDNGVLLQQSEYDKIRQKAIRAKENELYVYWTNEGSGMECKSVGPVSSCLCGHRCGNDL